MATRLGRSHAAPAAAQLVIGLVDNLSPPGARRTERQFSELIEVAAADEPVILRYFSLTSPASARPGVYGDLRALQACRLDGLVVTGSRPTTSDLRDEPIWPRLTAVVDLARERAIPTVWSCLSAHAAVLHLHGIRRRKLPRKLSGVVECTRTATDHPIVAGAPPAWRVPHSRYNDLPEPELVAAGYQILSHSAEAGADTFVLDDGAPFLFFQGHPEYEARTLLREYHRDIGEYLCGERQDVSAQPRASTDWPCRVMRIA